MTEERELVISGRAVIVVGFAAFVMALVLINALVRGEAKLKYGLLISRRNGPVEFWIGMVVLSVAALIVIGAFVFCLMGWLRRDH